MRHLKARETLTQGPGTDVPAVLDLHQDGRSLGLLFPTGGGRAESLTRIATAASLSDADLIVFAFEGYAFIGPDLPDPLPSAANHDLAQMFAAGHDQVRECVNVLAADRVGACTALVNPFRYDGDLLVWEATIGHDGFTGDIPLAFAAGFAAQAARPEPPLDVPSIAALLGCPCGTAPNAAATF